MIDKSEFDRAQKLKRKAERERIKQEAKGYPKCAPWKHQFETISMSGLGMSYLDRCARCLWWKTWGMYADQAWSQMHPPPRYQEEYDHYLKQKAKLEKPRLKILGLFGRNRK